MKNKKFLPAIILGAAVLAMVLYSFISCIAIKPTVTEANFPFTITYELDGKTVVIDEVYKARYVPNDKDDNGKGRVYVGEIGNRGENETIYTLKKEGNTRLELWTYFYADYMMGDPEYIYFDDFAFEPKLYYFDAEEQEYSDAETLAAHGVKLISFTYPKPIENSMAFSHISYCDSMVVLPVLLIAILAFVAILIFVKKEKESKHKVIDVISIVLNFAIGIILFPFTTILALLIDIEGGGPELYYQVTYFIPSFIVCCLGASVALRRRGHGVISLLTQLAAPVFFAVYVLVYSMV